MSHSISSSLSLDSPPIPRHFSSNPASRQEELINAYEAEEERIINTLSRKLEKLREEKIDLENTLEAESESHVNKLSRELTALRLAQHNPLGTPQHVNGSMTPLSPGGPSYVPEPSTDIILDSLRRENESLRNTLVDIERDYIRISRLNEIYREELIEHRSRLGLPVDSLVGLASADPYPQPTFRRRPSNASSPSSSSAVHLPAPQPQHQRPVATSGVIPIPRPPSQIHRPSSIIPPHHHHQSQSVTSPSGASSSSSDYPFSFSSSPVTSPMTGSSAMGMNGSSGSMIPSSINTTQTTPASTSSQNTGVTFATPARGLSYPSVPPPSLSSSFQGSPSVSYISSNVHSRYPSGGGGSGGTSTSPSVSRRSSINAGFTSRRGSVGGSGGAGRRESLERLGARVAETGSLIRGRADSASGSGSGSATGRGRADSGGPSRGRSASFGNGTPGEEGGAAMLDGLLEEDGHELEFDPGEIGGVVGTAKM